MGLGSHMMKGLVREAAFRPFSGVAYTLGRVATGASPEETLAMFADVGVAPALADLRELIPDTVTDHSRSADRPLIRDVDFLRLLGFRDVKAVDASPFEGAEIVLDLNKPIGKDLEGRADLIVDPSTLDNIFDPTTGLRNIARLLKPGGRCMLVNMGNTSPTYSGIPYTMFTPTWFYDYFAANDFEACDVYAHVYVGHYGVSHQLDHDHALQQRTAVKPVPSRWPLIVCVFAEKGAGSTWDRMPTHPKHRSEAAWARFRASVERFKRSSRPPLLRSDHDMVLPDIGPGWHRIRPNGELVAPGDLRQGTRAA
jgi:hypothetical protein